MLLNGFVATGNCNISCVDKPSAGDAIAEGHSFKEPLLFQPRRQSWYAQILGLSLKLLVPREMVSFISIPEQRHLASPEILDGMLEDIRVCVDKVTSVKLTVVGPATGHQASEKVALLEGGG